MELADLNVLNPFVRAVRFSELDILDGSCSGQNGHYLLMAHLKPGDLALVRRTIAGLWRMDEIRFGASKQRGDPHLESRHDDSLSIYTDFMYSFTRWSLIAGNFGTADRALRALERLPPAASPAHVFLSTLTRNGKAAVLEPAEELESWMECVRTTESELVITRHPEVSFTLNIMLILLSMIYF